jgi:hypothetical protein
VTTWADEARVLELTGVSVTSEQLDQAQGVLDVYAGVTVEAAANLSARDLRLLGQALAYQAAWMNRQLDVFSRLEVSEVDQDGMRFKPSSQDALILAPLADRCLRRLSWAQPRSVRVSSACATRRRFASVEAAQAAFLADEGGFGSGSDWLPLP